MSTQPPRHPGLIMRETTLPRLGLTVTQAAKEMKIARQTLHRVLAGQAAISPEMALRIGKLTASRPETWLDMQQRHDLWRANAALAPLLETIATHSPAHATLLVAGSQNA